MHPIFEKLCETLSGDAMAKLNDQVIEAMMTGHAAVLVTPEADGVKFERVAPVFTPFTDADAERLAGLLNGGEK